MVFSFQSQCWRSKQIRGKVGKQRKHPKLNHSRTSIKAHWCQVGLHLLVWGSTKVLLYICTNWVQEVRRTHVITWPQWAGCKWPMKHIRVQLKWPLNKRILHSFFSSSSRNVNASLFCPVRTSLLNSSWILRNSADIFENECWTWLPRNPQMNNHNKQQNKQTKIWQTKHND